MINIHHDREEKHDPKNHGCFHSTEAKVKHVNRHVTLNGLRIHLVYGVKMVGSHQARCHFFQLLFLRFAICVMLFDEQLLHILF